MLVPGLCVAREALSWLTSVHFWETNVGYWHIWACDYAVSVTLANVLLIPGKLGEIYKTVQVKRSFSSSFLMLSLVLPDHPEAGLEDERCPLMTGCDRAGGQCVCDARHSCLGSFTYPDQESCMKAGKSGKQSPSITHVETQMHVQNWTQRE